MTGWRCCFPRLAKNPRQYTRPCGIRFLREGSAYGRSWCLHREKALPGTAGYAVAALARRFVDSYNAHGNVPMACAEAIRAPEAQDVLDFLNSFGYDNPTYTWDDLCPFTTEAIND